MSLETALAENTAALKALTSALTANAVAQPRTKDAEPAPVPKTEKPKAENKEKKAEAPGVDYETQVKPAVLNFVRTHGREAMDELLRSKFGAESAKQVKPSDYAKLLEEIKTLEAQEAGEVA